MERIDLTPPKPDNIIAIDAESEKQLEITLKKEKRDKSCIGQHIQVQVDLERRLLICRHCGVFVDPFDYVLKWARDGHHRMSGLKGIETRCKIARAENDNLERRIKNLRQRLKRAGEAQPQSERSVFDVAKWNLQREDLVNDALRLGSASSDQT
jgi:hypothetical protein